MRVPEKQVNATMLVMFLVLLAACRAMTQERFLTPADNQYKATTVPLVWLHTGKHLLVGDQWLFSVDEKKFSPLTRPEEEKVLWALLLSPDNKQILWFDGKKRLIPGGIEGNINDSIVIPSWLSDKHINITTSVNVVFWLNEHVIFVQQFDAEQPAPYACGYFRIDNEQWTRIPDNACLEPSFLHLFKVSALTDDLFMLYSAGEGLHALDLVKFTPLTQTAATQTLLGEITLDALVPVQTQIQTGNTLAVSLNFPCKLASGKTIRCIEAGKQGQAIYEWSVNTGALKPRWTDLPEGSVLSPDEQRFAWVQADGVCIGKPGGGAVVCTQLPVSLSLQ